MTFLEKQTDPTSPMHWLGDMQADYMYTSGVAGDRFFKTLMKKGTFLATRCPECKKVNKPIAKVCDYCGANLIAPQGQSGGAPPPPAGTPPKLPPKPPGPPTPPKPPGE